MDRSLPRPVARPWLGAVGAVGGSVAPLALAFLLVGLAGRATGVDVPWVAFAVVLLGLRTVTGVSVSAVLHRWGAHRSVELDPVLRDLLRIWAWLWTGLGVRTWAAVHRRHHADPDGPDALFTPAGPRGFLAIGPMTIGAHWAAIRDPEPFERLVPDLPDDALERFFRAEERRLFGVLGVRIPLLVSLHVLPWLAVAPPGPAVLLGLCTLPGTVGAITSGAVWIVNGLGHHAGHRPHDTPDRSANVVRIDIWMLGEGLHNNHHARPASANFALGPGELDPTYQILRVLAAVGLARLGRPPRA